MSDPDKAGIAQPSNPPPLKIGGDTTVKKETLFCTMFDSMENLFYNQDYLDIQAHDQLCVFEDDQFRILFSIEDDLAGSLPWGLFGSFGKKKKSTLGEFSTFVKNMMVQLRKKGVHRIKLIQPSTIYSGFVQADWLESMGFSEMYADINHHVELGDFQMHPMELRKLEKLNRSGLVIQNLAQNQLPEVYDFIARCREGKGLELNIFFEKLEALFLIFPKRYLIFGAYLKGTLVSAVITVQTASDVVYYYLPGTLETFKKESPMVGLIVHLVDYFKTRVKFLDLGVSSIEGIPQEGLIAFKERMGGVRGEKKVYNMKV